MQNCNHRVMFKVDIANNSTPSGVIITCGIKARCSLCNYDLTEVDIKSALEAVYVPDVADMIFNMYHHKKSFYSLLSKLSSFGISNPIIEDK